MFIYYLVGFIALERKYILSIDLAAVAYFPNQAGPFSTPPSPLLYALWAFTNCAGDGLCKQQTHNPHANLSFKNTITTRTPSNPPQPVSMYFPKLTLCWSAWQASKQKKCTDLTERETGTLTYAHETTKNATATALH